MSQPFLREESESDGVIHLRNVPVIAPDDPEIDAIILLEGLERNLGGFVVQVFVDHTDATESAAALDRDHPRFLAEMPMYASMSYVVPEDERPELAPDIAAPLPLEPYDTFIDISSVRALVGDRETVDLTVVLKAVTGEPVPADLFRAASVSIQINPSRTTT